MEDGEKEREIWIDRLAGGLNKYWRERNGVRRQRGVGRGKGKDGLKSFFYSSIKK